MIGRQTSDTGPSLDAGRVRLVPKSSPWSWIAMAVSTAALTLAAYAIARTSLFACGFGILGVSFSNCPEAPAPVVQPVDEEAERATALEAESEQLERQLRHAKAAIAATAACPVPPPPRRAEAPPPPPPPPAQEPLKLPQRTADLKGCWQSDRGDIQVVSDDDQQRPIGKVRVCHCFGDNGSGSITLVYTDNVVCRGQVSAKVTDQELTIARPEFSCGNRAGINRGLVKAVTTCRTSGEQGGAALCDTKEFGQMRRSQNGESFHRIASNECAVPGG